MYALIHLLVIYVKSMKRKSIKGIVKSYRENNVPGYLLWYVPGNKIIVSKWISSSNICYLIQITKLFRSLTVNVRSVPWWLIKSFSLSRVLTVGKTQVCGRESWVITQSSLWLLASGKLI